MDYKKSFLVKLSGLLQCISIPPVIQIGYQNDAEAKAFQRVMASADLWLRPGRLTDFRVQDFPHLSNEKDRIGELIATFDEIAKLDNEETRLSIDLRKKAFNALIELELLFKDDLSERSD